MGAHAPVRTAAHKVLAVSTGLFYVWAMFEYYSRLGRIVGRAKAGCVSDGACPQADEAWPPRGLWRVDVKWAPWTLDMMKQHIHDRLDVKWLPGC